MTKAKDTQPQQDSNSFDPMETFAKYSQDAMARLQGFYGELAGVEAKAYDRAKATSEQLSELTSQSIDYATKLCAEWRKAGLEMAKRSTELFRHSA